VPIDMALQRILFSKHVCINVAKILLISFAMITTTSDVIINEHAAASLPSDLASLNNDHKFQTLQQNILQNVSQFVSTLSPVDFAFSYSFGILDETNNTISSEHNIYIKDSEDNQPTNITFALSEVQMQDIWTSIMETGFFQIKNNFTENCDNSGNCVLVTPEHYYILKVTGNNTHTVIAHEGYAFPDDEEYQKFKSLIDTIDSMIETVVYQDGNNNIPPIDREPERGFI
jgi:hypothetical protein